MWDMAKHSIISFFQGRLFANPGLVYRQIAIGAIIAAAILFGLAKLGVNPIVAAAVAGFVGGALQPFLFKNLKYR